MTYSSEQDLNPVSKKQQITSRDQSLAFYEHFYDSRQTREDYFTSKGIALPDQLQQAITKRRLDYLAGRYCAHQALAKLKHKLDGQIPSSPSRAPQWPEGFIGSITHTKDYAAALVGSRSHWYGLGLDAELVVDESKPALVQHVCRPEEFDSLSGQFTKEVLFTIIFSAKESLFKALYPHVRKYFGFQSARVLQIDEIQCRFTIQLVQDLNPKIVSMQEFEGKFEHRDDRILTLIQIPNTLPGLSPDFQPPS